MPTRDLIIIISTHYTSDHRSSSKIIESPPVIGKSLRSLPPSDFQIHWRSCSQSPHCRRHTIRSSAAYNQWFSITSVKLILVQSCSKVEPNTNAIRECLTIRNAVCTVFDRVINLLVVICTFNASLLWVTWWCVTNYVQYKLYIHLLILSGTGSSARPKTMQAWKYEANFNFYSVYILYALNVGSENSKQPWWVCTVQTLQVDVGRREEKNKGCNRSSHVV